MVGAREATNSIEEHAIAVHLIIIPPTLVKIAIW